MSSQSFIDRHIKDHGLLNPLEDYPRKLENIVFRKFANQLAGPSTLIEGFNNWVDNGYKNQIFENSFTAEDGTRINFENPNLENPTVIIDGKKEILYPQYCRNNNIPYSGKLTCDVNVIKTNGEQIKTSIELGKIPIMIRSKKCNLYQKTEEELISLKECISDPGGYFILKSERSVVTQDKARMLVPLIYTEKGKLECKYTSCRKGKNGSKVFKMVIGKKWPTLKVIDSFEKNSQMSLEKSLPVFVIFKILDNIEPEKAVLKYIINFIPNKYKRRCVNFLNSSIIKTKNIEDIIRYISRKRRKKFTLSTRDELYKEYKDSIIENLFPNIDTPDEEETIRLKLQLLGYIVSRFLLVIIGKIAEDSRDSWINKRFDAAGTLVKILLGSVMSALVSSCVKDITKFTNKPSFSTFGNTIRSKASPFITRDFNSSFNTDSWGTKSYGKLKLNYTETTQRATPLALWSQTAKNNSGVSRRAKNFQIREVHPSQKDKHCIFETPEGANVSLVKYDAITSRFSLDTDPKIVIEYAKDHFGNYQEEVMGESTDIILMINGTFTSYKEKNINVVYCNYSCISYLREGKITGKISLDTEIFYDDTIKCLQIYTDASRATSPYFIVNQETQDLIINEKNLWNLEYKDLIKSGCVEFLSAKECDDERTLICYSYDYLKKMRQKYNSLTSASEKTRHKDFYTFTHCNIDPVQMLSVSAGTCPFSNRQPGPRTTFQASMGKQALGMFNTNYHEKFYGGTGGVKRLHRGTRSFCETDVYFIPMMDIMPSGQTAMVAFMTDGDNQEDAIIVSEDFINTGNLNYIKYTTVKYIQPGFKIGTREVLQKPEIKTDSDIKKYRNIQENGLPKLDTYLNEGDCVLGKVKIDKDGNVKNNSQFCTLGEEGFVDRIIISREKDQGNLYIKIRLRKMRRYQAGDKLAIRYSQKGTIGRVEKRENMLRVSSGVNKGISPDIIFNPHGFPSRQTAGLLLEGILTKASLYEGKRVDVTAFRDLDVEGAMNKLEEYGLDKYGYEEMEFPNGEKLDSKIYMVPIYEQVLRHQVEDKIQVRSTGVKSLYTHQPRGGRSQRGGQKVGEMEKDSFVAHGASGVMIERLMKVSDEFKFLVCQNCGSMINNINCTVCDKSTPGLITTPYVFKLLINLLNGIGIDIRINTKPVEIEED